jgi:hypothetical protein
VSELDVSEFVEEGDFDGHGRTFEDAVEDAWQKAKPQFGPGTWCKVKHHWVRMVNPVSEHKVVIRPGE